MSQTAAPSGIKATLDQNIAQFTAPGAPWELDRLTLHGHEYTIYKNAPATLRALTDAGRNHGDNPFIVYEGERLSFNQFFNLADRMANQLAGKYGINPGDRVAICMRNYPEWMAAFVAITGMGAVVVPMNSWWQQRELVYGLEDSGARLVFCDQQRFDYIADHVAKADDLVAVVVRADHVPADHNAVSLETFLEGAVASMPQNPIQPDDLAMIMYTSGTTGTPKGAASTHRAIGQAIYNFELGGTVAAMANMDLIGKMLAKGYPQTALLAVPLFHVSGCHSLFLLSLRAGRKIVMMYKWSAEKALELIEKERVTSVSAVPSMLIDLLNHPKFGDYKTDSLFAVGGGGAAQPAKLSGMLQKQIPDSFPGTGYGMTETNATGYSCTGAAYHYKPRSAGTSTPIVQTRICDENGHELPPGQPGEIWLKTPTMVEGYWNRPDATAETFRGGWVVTGDIGYLDDEGFIFLVDRAKDMIIRGGENIASAEVEAAIYEHPDVQEVAAIGLPHERLGEELAVVVKPKPGATLNPDAIKAHTAERLAAFKVPAHVVIETGELPKNATGKVLKKALKTQVMQQLGINE
ncbi:MAG: long-chain fatty acid--CoA ligase [Gammaproteobacteria bacterium]|nr:MAG: long-chain fatty acid--CoA ligase [Gammaproteobacteria bacterium]